MAVKPIPDGYHALTPYLVVGDAAKAIEFYRGAFGAEEIMRMGEPGGKVGHAELRIGDSVVMLADEHPEVDARSPETIGGSPVSIVLYVEDSDAVYDRAVKLGATAERPVENQFYGDRAGTVRDPFGHRWHIHTTVEEVSPQEMERRMKEAASSG
jgi:PhnB protein